MIFRPELAKAILQRKKSQTRRIATAKTCRYRAGKSYAVQPGRGKTAVCRITITDVRLEALGAITLKDARKEGFVTTDEFRDYWASLYGRFDPDLLVWVLSFQFGDQTDTPRLLAARPGAPHGDYVSNPHLSLRDEQEAVSAAETERYGKLAHARDSKRMSDPLRKQRDTIARALAEMREQLNRQPSRHVADTVRRMEREMAVLDRKLAA